MTKKILLLLLISLSAFSGVNAQIITTLTGNGFGTHTGDGGPATAATLNTPFGVALDSRGNIYVAEYTNYVRKIDHKGIITTIAGGAPMPPTGGPLGDGGPATAAYLDVLYDLALDAADNLYIVDQGLGRIRRVDAATGIISTYAGGGTFLGNGVPATASNLIGMNGITISAAGDMYVAMGPIVRKIDAATGNINTIAGTGTTGYSGDGGPATAAQLWGAFDIAADRAGNLFFTDQNTNCVRRIDTRGIITTIAGNGSVTGGYAGDGGPASGAVFDMPWGITTDQNDNIYVCDIWNGRLRKIDPTTWKIKSVVGCGTTGYGGDGGPATAAFYAPDNVAVDCAGNYYLTGSWDRLRKVTFGHTPYFTATKDSIVGCQNSEFMSIDTLLAAGEKDTLTMLDWTVDVPPVHGTIGGVTYTAPTTKDTIVPRGLYYKPGRGFSGIDSFTMMVGYCSQVADWRKIYVRVKPAPYLAAITGVDSVCTGNTLMLTDATPGGTWGMMHAGANVSNGVVTGVFSGTDSVVYSITDPVTGCNNSTLFGIKVVDCHPGGIKPLTPEGGLSLFPNPAKNMVHVNGAISTAKYKLMDMVGAVLQEGALDGRNNSISLAGLPKGVYLIDLADSYTGERVTRRVVKE